MDPRILLLEDDSHDAELVERTLRREGIPSTLRRAVTEADFRNALAEFNPDLILADNSLPDLDGRRALSIARESRPEASFIFVSGTLGEEFAIEALKSGATDYVLKDRMSRLGPVVRRALREVEERRENRLRESALRESQKMEALGRLAGSIAHDFNNLLTAILSYADLTLARLPSGDPLRVGVERTMRAAEKAANLTRQLLAFSRASPVELAVIEPGRVVIEMADILRSSLGEQVKIELHVPPDLGRVRAAATQIEQVLLNLCINARDAMPDGGAVTIEASNVRLGESQARSGAGIQPGDYVRLTVADTGCGMSEEVRTHLFEPFFSTKRATGGTGLGLSTVYGIVKQAGGHVDVESSPEHGATFHVYLPRVEMAADPESESSASAAAPARGSETVLLVEDEEEVRILLVEVLRASGYEVLAAADPLAALSIAQDREAPIELLLTDVVLPVMPGPQLARRLGVRHPESRVLYMSGYAPTEGKTSQRSGLDGPYIQKPFLPDLLARRVREVLDSPAPE